MKNVKQVIEAYSFATLVTTKDQRPVATHLPMQLRTINGEDYITSHLAKENNQVSDLENASKEVLVIFQGPHAYVSSSCWYESENVPTWNYKTVHIYGTPSIMSEKELKEDLTLLLEKYERGRKNAVLWETLSEQTKKQMAAIIGFKIKVNKIEAAAKLSQNRNDTDYTNIIDELDKGDLFSKEVAKAMKKRR